MPDPRILYPEEFDPLHLAAEVGALDKDEVEATLQRGDRLHQAFYKVVREEEEVEENW